MIADLSRARRILCLGAHADDIEIGCGGTLLQIIAANPHVVIDWVVLSGNAERAAEARHSYEAFTAQAGERQFIAKTFRDSYFPYIGGEIKDFFHELAREVAPDLIFTHRRDDLHQDHRLVAELTANAFRGPTILEYEIPKFDGDLGPMNVYSPLSGEFAAEKTSKLLSHFPSQHAKPWFREENFWALLRLRGLEAAAPLAEAFSCRKLVLGRP